MAMARLRCLGKWIPMAARVVFIVHCASGSALAISEQNICALFRRQNEENEVIFLCAMSIVGQCLHHFTGRRVIAAFRPNSFDPGDIERVVDHITRFSLAGIRELRAAPSP